MKLSTLAAQAAVLMLCLSVAAGADDRSPPRAVRSVHPNYTAPKADLDAYDIVFTSPSKDEAESIPLGNGGTGINLWVEENGDLLFYLCTTTPFRKCTGC